MSENQELKTIKEWKDKGYIVKRDQPHRGKTDANNWLFGPDQVSRLLSEDQQQFFWMIKGQFDDLQKILKADYPTQETLERLTTILESMLETAEASQIQDAQEVNHGS